VSSGVSSSIQNTETQGKCQLVESLKQILYAGRNWKEDNQWYSGTWEDYIWTGFEKGSYWAVDADWDVKLYCLKEAAWPFRAYCSNWKGNMEIWTADIQWAPRYFWWYATDTEKSAGTKRCLDKYSAADEQTFGWDIAPTTSSLTNEEYNGQFWESGFAVTTTAAPNVATWKSVTSVTFSGSTISSPYPWVPTDNSIKCNLVWGTGASDYSEVTWKCALDGTSSGYWGSVAGTTEFK
jgi:hypothetical protein